MAGLSCSCVTADQHGHGAVAVREHTFQVLDLWQVVDDDVRVVRVQRQVILVVTLGLVALTVAFSLLGVVLWGTLSGSMLPILLKKLGADPAASSAPFVATLVDVTGLIIYFTVAVVIMRGTLL